MKTRILFPALLVLGWLLTPAFAAETPKADADQSEVSAARAELDRARDELRRAARHLAEISGSLAQDDEDFDQREVIQIRRLRSGRPMIGIILAEGEPAAVRIAGVTPDSPAAKAGLRAGDQLLAIDGQRFTSATPRERIDQLTGAMTKVKEGDAIALVVRRDQKESTVTVTAVNMPPMMRWQGGGRGRSDAPRGDFHRFHGMIDPEVEMEIEQMAPQADCAGNRENCRFKVLAQAFRWSGLSLAEMNAGLGRYFGGDSGALVLRDGSEGLAEIKAGDVILRVDGASVDGPRATMRALRDRAAGSVVKLDVLRDRKSRTLEVTVPKARHLEFFAPPAPPAPPSPPVAPTPPAAPSPSAAPAAPAAPPAAPTPPLAVALT